MSTEQTTLNLSKMSAADVKCILETYDLSDEDREEYEYIYDLLFALESKPEYNIGDAFIDTGIEDA
jgi:hypothetical protein